ncbi:hypothetical protein ABPG73_015292 [Tetrahymena malaccensis]
MELNNNQINDKMKQFNNLSYGTNQQTNSYNKKQQQNIIIQNEQVQKSFLTPQQTQLKKFEANIVQQNSTDLKKQKAIQKLKTNNQIIQIYNEQAKKPSQTQQQNQIIIYNDEAINQRQQNQYSIENKKKYSQNDNKQYSQASIKKNLNKSQLKGQIIQNKRSQTKPQIIYHPQQILFDYNIPNDEYYYPQGQSTLILSQSYSNQEQISFHKFHSLNDMYQEDEIQENLFQHKNNTYDLEKGLSLDIKTLHKHFQFNKDEDQSIPIMVSVKTLDSTNYKDIQSNLLEGRPNIDLICVIDISASMSGEKIKSVKQAIIQLINMLNENDRLCKLFLVTISIDTGTDITSGIEKAFQVLNQRKMKNSVASIFLLSDGQHDEAYDQIHFLLQNQYKQLERECFTIHTFGFGDDHDGPLMQKIAKIKDGNFYYVERNNQIDEFFIDALGGLFSVVAQDINIKIKINRQNELFNKFFKHSFISKTYGSMWKTIKRNQELSIQINQLFSGVSKDFIFEVVVPKSIVYQIEDFERSIQVVNVQLTAVPINSEYTTNVIKESNLVLTIFSQNEKIAQDSEKDDQVEFNYTRVKAAQAIEEAIKYAQKNQHSQGQDILQNMITNINKINPKNQEKLQIIKQDLADCHINIQPQIYELQGQHQLIQQCNNHYYQQSSAINTDRDFYQNQCQKLLVRQNYYQLPQAPTPVTKCFIHQVNQVLTSKYSSQLNPTGIPLPGFKFL